MSSDLALQLKSVIETAIDGIITINHRGIAESVNPAAAKLFDYQPEDIIGNNIKMLMPEPDRTNHDEYISRYEKTRQPHIIGIGREVFGKRKDGSIFPLRLAVSEVILNDRVIYTGIIHDLSAVKEAQKKIEQLNKELENKIKERTNQLEKTVNKLLSTNSTLVKEVKERQKAESALKRNEDELKEALSKEKELNELKSRFVSMASHEFKTPLTSILSSASLIGRYTQEDHQPNREKHVERIKSAVSNLTGILNDFLSLSKLEEGRVDLSLEPCDINTLCEDVSDHLTNLLSTDQKIIKSIDGNFKEIQTDIRILKNILFNLISNAIKYSDKDIHCIFKFDNDHLEIKVKDQGIGIPEEDQKYLFSRFFRAGNVTNIQGTGLGLNIVERYVHLLEGEISFNSVQEKGTTFIVKLPYL